MGAPLKPTSTPGIYKRGSQYAVRFTDPTGKVRQRAASTLTEARGSAALTADVARGKYRATSKVRFADYAETWLETYRGGPGAASGPRTCASTVARTRAVRRSRLFVGGCWPRSSHATSRPSL